MQLAGRKVMQEAATTLQNATDKIPEISPFLNLIEFNQADIQTQGVLGFYSTESRNIVIGNRAVEYVNSGKSSIAVPTTEGVVAHEIGHALSYHQQSGFRSTGQAVAVAYERYNQRRSRKSSIEQFVGTISPYAKTDSHEAFAEAFADWSVNGTRAKTASRLIVSSWQNR
jgi:hypothetical protein